MGSSAVQKTESADGREPPSGKGVTSLRTQQRECARLHVLGWSNKRIADELGFKTKTIGAWLRTPIVKEYVQALSAVRERGALAVFEDLQRNYLPEAVQVEVEIMRQEGARNADRLNAAQDVMDRGGLPKVSRQQVARSGPQLISINITESQEKAIRKALEGPKEEINDVSWEIVKDDDE